MKNFRIVLSLFLFFFSFSTIAKTDRPFVFIHGLCVPSAIYQIPFSLEALFKAQGHQLIVVKSPAITTLNKAREYAISDIIKKLPTGTFHLIGHSQGGIVSRLLANDLRIKNRILSVTTLDTPHHGTPMADDIAKLWLESAGHLPNWAQDILDNYFGGSIDALKEMSVESMENKFNISVLDNSKIRYFSMGHYIPFPEWKYTAIDIVAATSIYLKLHGAYPNDGALSLSSSYWGQSLGDYPGDHFSESFPIPFNGKFIVGENFKRVIDNIDKQF